jgi:argininosuccinate lyase
MTDKKKLWGGRFSGAVADITERLSTSIHYDSRMYSQDIRGSKAHAAMLKKIGVLNDKELESIISGLDIIQQEIEDGSFEFSSALEDIHMNIESKLTERIGDAGKKLHTGRSRNDQVAVDRRLYFRDVCKDEDNIDTFIPGYTHLQVAQPVRFAQHLLAYVWKFSRDLTRLQAVYNSCKSLPLGVGALSGVNYANDRDFLKDELEFDSIMMNSMDAVSDRDFVLDFLYFAAVTGTHLSRLSEEFSYIKLSDKVTTGSSIMPQKRNPDLAELIRGKSGRLYGNLMAMLTVLKGLPMTYNRDLQEDKEPFMDSADTIRMSLEGMAVMFQEMTVLKENMKNAVYSNFSTATDLADYCVQKGLPFREAHEVVGSVVRYCEDNNEDFFTLSLEKLKKFSDIFDDDISDILNPELSTERKLSAGSTARDEIL